MYKKRKRAHTTRHVAATDQISIIMHVCRRSRSATVIAHVHLNGVRACRSVFNHSRHVVAMWGRVAACVCTRDISVSFICTSEHWVAGQNDNNNKTTNRTRRPVCLTGFTAPSPLPSNCECVTSKVVADAFGPVRCATHARSSYISGAHDGESDPMKIRAVTSLHGGATNNFTTSSHLSMHHVPGIP